MSAEISPLVASKQLQRKAKLDELQKNLLIVRRLRRLKKGSILEFLWVKQLDNARNGVGHQFNLVGTSFLMSFFNLRKSA